MACAWYSQVASYLRQGFTIYKKFFKKTRFPLFGFKQKSVEIGHDLPGLKLRTLHVGGLPGTVNRVNKGFVGCIQVGRIVCASKCSHLLKCWIGSLQQFLEQLLHQGVRIGETSSNVANVNIAQGVKIRVEDGCDLADPCDSNICPENSHCSDDWNTHTCICDPGNPYWIKHWKGSF